ncbi:DUF2510 domain-containing protein [Knoellia sp. S7-12]|uniref:DUF2510 domain-containing protein n=1 Tax=Knoellia sp. S7-12 TaxID=3126698 RepID=UPI003368B964
MTTSQPTTGNNSARWAPDPEVRGKYRYWDGAQWTAHTVDALTATRPELPTWFRSATNCLYAVCGLMSAALLALCVADTTNSAPTGIIDGLASLAATAVMVLVLLVGAWAFTLANSAHVDLTSLTHDPVWLLVAWFIPIIHVVFPFQLLSQTWASARRVRTGRNGSPASLDTPRPWIIHAWAWAWALSTGGLLVLWFVGVELATLMAGILAANAVMAALLAGVIRVIVREIDGSVVSPTVS